jgi:phosphoglycolate phosphatase-like HAD superfamily hydrolase
VRFILFDIDGTLIDGSGIGRRALERAFADVFDMDAVPDVAGRVTFNGALDPDIHRQMAEVLGLAPEQLERLRDELHARYLHHLRSTARQGPGSRVLPGVRALLERLAGRSDVALGLLTGNIEAGARLKLEPHDLNRFFPTGGFGEDGPTRADVARAAVGRLARRNGGEAPAPGRVLVVGDSIRDVECGRANGYRTLAVQTGWTPREELAAAGPDLLVADLSETDELMGHLISDG